MFDLVTKLRDLKALIPAAYYADLLALVRSAIGGDWRAVHSGLFDLAKTVTHHLLFGAEQGMSEASVVELEDALNAALSDLETVQGATADAKLDPGTWLAIVGAVVELIKLIRDRKK